MKVLLEEEKGAREAAEAEARGHAASHAASKEQVELITAQSAKMAKEAADFEAKHAVEEAARRAEAREEAEQWAREQVAAERAARAEAERVAQIQVGPTVNRFTSNRDVIHP